MDVTCAAGSITDEETFLSVSKYVDRWTQTSCVSVHSHSSRVLEWLEFCYFLRLS